MKYLIHSVYKTDQKSSKTSLEINSFPNKTPNMKLILIVALLCIGTVAAQAPVPQADSGRVLAEFLEKRADALVQQVKALINEHKAVSFLLHGLEQQLVELEALHAELKTQLAQKDAIFHIHQIHVIEENLLHLENRVSEEISIFHLFGNGHNPIPTENGPQLIVRGQQLVKDAQAAVAKKPNAPEAREINSSVIVVEALIKAIQAKPAPSAAELQKDQQELARQEHSLRQLIDKLNARKN